MSLRCAPSVLLLLPLLACGGKDTGAEEAALVPGGPRSGLTEAGRWSLRYTADPTPIPFNEPFSMSWTVEAQGEAPEATGLLVEPFMPAHGHGGATTPSTAAVEGGFLTTDLQLHMPGEWELRIRVDADGVDDVLVLPYTCCEGY
jgi:hypothetical protein